MVRGLVTAVALVGLAASFLLLSSPESPERRGAPETTVAAEEVRPTAPPIAARAAESVVPIEREAKAPEPAPVATLEPWTGIVVHDGGAPVPNARVELEVSVLPGLPRAGEAAAEPRRAHLASGADGRFEIPEAFRVPHRTLAIAEREGLARGSAHLDESRTMRIVLGRPATLRGRVLEEGTGAPIAGAELRLHPMLSPVDARRSLPPRTRRTTTRGDGSFAFGRCYVGETLVLTVWPADSTPHTERTTPETIGEHRHDIFVDLGETLFGRAVDAATGLGVGGARVSANGNRTGETRADGTFRIRRRPAPPFSLEVAADGYLAALERIGVDRVEEPSVVVSLVAETTLEGRVVDTRGAPLAGVAVSLHDAYGEGGRAVTDRSGAYVVGGIAAPKRYEVRVSTGEGATPYRLETESFERSGERRRRDIVLPADVASVVGRITRDGVAARARVEWAGGGIAAERRTDDEGNFSFDGVPVGTVELSVRTTDPSAHERRSLALARGETRRVDVDVRSGASAIEGTVLDVDGNPAAGVEVVATGRESRALLRATTDGEGRFALAAPSATESFDLKVTVDGRTLSRFDVAVGAAALVLRPSR
ncbi:MAG: carboxypeptidase regulatory-like domain-containing protein [Planctomycetota bacterium JB042]